MDSPLITLAQIKACWPQCKNPTLWAVALPPAFERFLIRSREGMAAFMAVCAEESGQGNTLVESLNYAASALPLKFSAFEANQSLALKYGRTDKQAANQFWIGEVAYGNRMGNGAPGSGDGFGNRGSGAIQETGRDNLLIGAQFFGKSLEVYREWLRTPEGAAMGAARYWQANGLGAYAATGTTANFKRLSGKVNRGNPDKEPVNWTSRAAHYDRCRKVFLLKAL